MKIALALYHSDQVRRKEPNRQSQTFRLKEKDIVSLELADSGHQKVRAQEV